MLKTFLSYSMFFTLEYLVAQLSKNATKWYSVQYISFIYYIFQYIISDFIYSQCEACFDENRS